MKKTLLPVLLLLLMLTMPAAADTTLPENLTEIEVQAFLNCTDLTGRLVIPDGVTEIGAEAFKGCTGLTELVLPRSVTKIGDRAFAGCTKLSGALVMSGVSIGEDAFDGTNVMVTDAITPVSEFAYAVNSDGTATITGFLGEMGDGVVTIPASIGGHTVTALGEGVFKQRAVEKVYLPETLTAIGDSAFENCGRLTAVYGGGSVTSYGARAFMYCEELSRLTINEGTELFGENAFMYCAKLTNTLYLPADVGYTPDTFYGSNIVALGFVVEGDTAALKLPFAGMPREHLTIPSSYRGLPVTKILCSEYPYGHNGPAYHLTIPATVEYIAPYSMRDFAAMVSVDFAEPSAMTELSDAAFSGLNNLESVDLPDGLKKIGSDVFKYDTKLASLTLPDGLETLGESSFSGTAIATINLPSAWTEIPDYAFSGMGLTEFTIPARITKLGMAALSNTKLTSLVIPETVQEVGPYTFASCTQLTTAVLPQHLTELPACAFQGCTALKEVDLPDGITWIGMMAFQGCTNLEYVELPPNMTYVLTCVFDECGVRTKAADRVVAACITDGMSDFEKALALHDWLINNADYSSHRTFFGAEGVLVYGEGVCQSYAEAYGMLLDRVGIAHKPVVSAEMDHSWNLIQLDGEWYHVDCTWDDPVGGEEQHIYFGLNDELMSESHTWDNPDSLPAANGTRYQYGVDNGK